VRATELKARAAKEEAARRADLGLIYRAATAAEAEQHMAEVEAKWKAYPSVSQVWRRNWARIIPFFNYPPDIRKAIYTTNSVESPMSGWRQSAHNAVSFRPVSSSVT
jgi:putative transposase